METRQAYEEERMDETAFSRCPRCLSLINPNSRRGEWTVNSAVGDAAGVVGSGAGAMLGEVNGFNRELPLIQKHVRGPMWMHLLIGVPPLLLFSGLSATFGGYAVPKFCQISVTSYYAALSASHYAISQVTRHVEETYSHDLQEKSI